MTSVEPQHGVGSPDGFQRLWTPHRLAYIQTGDTSGDQADGGCAFCSIPARDDEDGLIVRRGEVAYAVLNLFPYNPGHLLVCPYRHVADFTDLTVEEVAEVGTLTQQAMATIRVASAPRGFNLGVNQGEVAGAGIAAHLHEHVVPRWGGDANFMPIVAQTKVLPQLLRDTRDTLASGWVVAEPPAG